MGGADPPLVEQGREFKDAIAEVFAANAQLLALWRRQSMREAQEERAPATQLRVGLFSK